MSADSTAWQLIFICKGGQDRREWHIIALREFKDLLASGKENRLRDEGSEEKEQRRSKMMEREIRSPFCPSLFLSTRISVSR